MIITKLIGGLGNQMFQYAAGRNLAHKHSTTLKLDITGFKNDPLRSYELDNFNITESFASRDEIYTCKNMITILKKTFQFSFENALTGGQENLLKRKLVSLKEMMLYNRNLSFISYPRVYRQPHFHFDPNFYDLPNDTYLIGYWQSEKYFKNIEQIIKTEFTPCIPLKGNNLEMAHRIKENESVSVHFRCGDYLNNPNTATFHGNLKLDYYLKCIKIITEKLHKPHFFLFSDDPDLIFKNVKLEYPFTYVSHNDATTSFEDIHLMSMCKHNIISNSTFSWWAAWLNINPEKIVLCPKRWFKKLNINTFDLIPKKWLKV